MHFRRLTSAGDNLFSTAIDLYKCSFPAHEQRELSSQIAALGCGEYHFDLIYDEDEFVGILLYWETNHFIYVEHFCIEPCMRNRSYGQKALELLKERGKTIILEIDPITDELTQRRKAFYERAGFTGNPYEHIHPPYHPGNPGHSLIVMSLPGRLEPQDYDAFRFYLAHTVMNNL